MGTLRNRLLSASPRRLAVPLLLSLLIAFNLGPPNADAADITYVYDELGRLVGVVDPAGETVTHTYDAVGNLLRIDRISPSGPVAITMVNPAKGKAGTTVRLLGTGFSATPSQNTVAFNGVGASVLAATPTSLTTSVPAAATTGPITLTTPLGSATSPAPFRVLGAISVSPTSATVSIGQAQPFSAAEAGSATTTVAWSVNGLVGGDATVGTISAAGLYTAPVVAPGPGTVTVTASHTDDPSLRGSATLVILGAGAVLRSTSVSVRVAEPQTVNRNVAAAVSARIAEPATAVVVASPVTVAVEPVITGVSPASAAPGTSDLALTLTGAGFTGATSVSLLRNNAADSTITVTGLTVNGAGTQATVTVSVAAGAPTGGRVVRITTPGGVSMAMGTGGNVFTVQ